jgi:hypothetical protein
MAAVSAQRSGPRHRSSVAERHALDRKQPFSLQERAVCARSTFERPSTGLSDPDAADS